MARNRRLLIILLALAAVLLGLTLALRMGLFAGEEAGEEDASIVVSSIPVETVAAVEWSGGDSPALRLEKGSDGIWFCPDAPDLALDQEKVSDAVSPLCQVISVREIEGEDPASFGLSPARRQIRLELAEGQSVTYLVGDLNTYTNRYYFQLEGLETIHLVGYSVGQSMARTAEDYLPEAEASDSADASGDAAERAA